MRCFPIPLFILRVNVLKDNIIVNTQADMVHKVLYLFKIKLFLSTFYKCPFRALSVFFSFFFFDFD